MQLLKLISCFANWNLPSTSLDGADVIISHAGGAALDGTPGPINEYLASEIRRLHAETGLPIIAQGEVAECLKDLQLFGKIPKQSESPTYVDSTYVARIHKQVCDAHGWKHPILITYSHHLWRAKMVTLKAGFQDVRHTQLRTIYFASCSQRQMISPLFNIPREILCRILWVLQGKI